MYDSAIAAEWCEDAAARSGVYRLLARLWLREVDHGFLDRLSTPPLSELYVGAGGWLPEAFDDETVEQLEIDYCRLFVGPVDHLPPCQSVWQSGQFQGSAVESMSRFMKVIHYAVDGLPAGIMLDHLGVQLDVMVRILEHLSALPADSKDREAVSELAQSYFAAHLSWPSQLFEAAASRASSDFYRCMIGMTREFLALDARS